MVSDAVRKTVLRQWIPNLGIVALATVFGMGFGIVVDVVYFLSHWEMLPVIAMDLGSIVGALSGAIVVAIRVRNEFVDS